MAPPAASPREQILSLSLTGGEMLNWVKQKRLPPLLRGGGLLMVCNIPLRGSGG